MRSALLRVVVGNDGRLHTRGLLSTPDATLVPYRYVVVRCMEPICSARFHWRSSAKRQVGGWVGQTPRSMAREPSKMR